MTYQPQRGLSGKLFLIFILTVFGVAGFLNVLLGEAPIGSPQLSLGFLLVHTLMVLGFYAFALQAIGMEHKKAGILMIVILIFMFWFIIESYLRLR